MTKADFQDFIVDGSPEAQLLAGLDEQRLPRHVAIIMDGNGRWASQRQLPRVEGHRAGIRAVRDTVETAARLGVEVLTLYAFSRENWKRPKPEVDTLMELLKEYLAREMETLGRGGSLEGSAPLFARIETEFAEVREALEECRPGDGS